MVLSNFDTAFEPVIAQIRKFFVGGLAAIQKAINDADAPLTAWNAARHKALEAQIATTLNEMRKTGGDLADKLISASWKEGAGAAGAPSDATQKMFRISQSKIAQISAEMKRNLTDSVAEIGRWAQDGLRSAQIETLAQANLEGLSFDKQASRLRDYMNEKNLRMPRGYRGDLGSYVEMAARTNLAESNRLARRQRLLENDVSLIEIPRHDGACDTCRPWEGSIIALVPNKDGIPYYQAIRENRKTHLFGPNCKHERLVPVVEELYSRQRIIDKVEQARKAWRRFGGTISGGGWGFLDAFDFDSFGDK